MPFGSHGIYGSCGRSGGERLRGLVQPWLLLLLAQKPAHGYELMDQLGRLSQGMDIAPGLLYRTLRQLEEEGLVRSNWDTGGSGAARRVYELTEEGREYLHAWAVMLRKSREQLDQFLALYENLFSTPSQEA